MTNGELSSLRVNVYQLDEFEGIETTLERVGRRPNEPDRWAIREFSHCLNKAGKWEYEPSPSERDEAFLKRCRWDSAEEALAFWIEKGKSRQRMIRAGEYE